MLKQPTWFREVIFILAKIGNQAKERYKASQRSAYKVEVHDCQGRHDGPWNSMPSPNKSLTVDQAERNDRIKSNLTGTGTRANVREREPQCCKQQRLECRRGGCPVAGMVPDKKKMLLNHG